MDAETEKLCLEELDHSILDAGKKITLINISNDWNTTQKNGEIVLKKWLKKYSGDKRIAKEYLIRGTDVNGNAIITIVPEKSLPKIDKICPNHMRTLHSVEIGSENGRSLDIQEPSENKYIALKMKYDKRNIAVSKTVLPSKPTNAPEVAKKTANPFGAVQAKPNTTKDVKTESTSANSSKDVKVKKEQMSPKKSPIKNQPAAKPTAKAQQGKTASSISLFFSSKSSTSGMASTHDKSVSDAVSKIEQVKIKDEPVVQSDTANPSKRQYSNASDSAEDSKAAEKHQKVQAKKKMKLEPKSARSRLMQICDLSSDEDDSIAKNDTKATSETEIAVKKEKENKTPSPEKADANKSTASTNSRKRVKVKKMVTRTYEDEDGFINTVHETEEISCSDEEPEDVEPPIKKVVPSAPSTNGSSAASSSSKKKISPPAGKKQGSILSFFSKK